MPMLRVLNMARTSADDTPPESRLPYSLSENPVQLPSTFASVNENMAMMTIGA